MAAKLNMATAIKRFNALVDGELGMDFCRIGEEHTVGWNLRDMVSEIQYQIDCHYEYGHVYYEALHEYENYEPDERYYQEAIEMRKNALQRLAKLKRFVKAYEPYIADMKCKEGHCSKYDN